MWKVLTADCLERGCVHYLYFKAAPDGRIINICKAFPEGIPPEIAFDGEEHKKPFPGQKNDIVFEKEG